MADHTLSACSPLAGISRQFGTVTIAEVADRAIVSIATQSGGDAALKRALSQAYQIELPGIARSTASEIDSALLLGLQQDMVFLLFDCADPWPARVVANKLGGTAYLTDQSDAWAMIRISGARCSEALARICMLDLSLVIFHPVLSPERSWSILALLSSGRQTMFSCSCRHDPRRSRSGMR
ncbi:MAG: hypothetical protein ACTSSQ_02555, partial [Alphaproteobacteria bacterium]